MSPVIGRLAQFLVKQKIPDTSKYAGPPFRRHKFEGNALIDLKSLMKKAVDAYPNESELKDALEQFVDIGTP